MPSSPGLQLGKRACYQMPACRSPPRHCVRVNCWRRVSGTVRVAPCNGEEKAPRALPAAAFCGAEMGHPSPTRTWPDPLCTAAGLCRESCSVFSSNVQISDLCRVVHTSPSSRRRAGVMGQGCMRYAVEIVLGSTAMVPLNAEGRVLTCSACLLSTGKGQRGTNRCKEFLKGGLDECMIIFSPVSHFSMVVVCKCTGQTRDHGCMWDTRKSSSSGPPWGVRVVSAFAEGRMMQSVCLVTYTDTHEVPYQ